MTHRSIAEIRQELREAIDAEKAAAAERAAKVQPQWLFTVNPIVDKHHPVFDPSVRLYRIGGVVMNSRQLEAVGKPVPLEGAMTYAYNTKTHRFIVAVGGGTTYTNSQDCMDEPAAYVQAFSDGGDVTDIIKKYRP